ncbi:hypothetical protein DW082_00470 [Alistipes sp. AF48-12]|nr:hypothetical protein DW082_00470 [Alistipes sp. AF48-12]
MRIVMPTGTVLRPEISITSAVSAGNAGGVRAGQRPNGIGIFRVFAKNAVNLENRKSLFTFVLSKRF